EHIVDTIMQEVRDRNPGMVVIDALYDSPHFDAHRLVRGLVVNLASWQATTLAIADDALLEHSTPLLGLSDGGVRLAQTRATERTGRALEVLKLRGQAMLAGPHGMRINDDGVQVFPRLSSPMLSSGPRPMATARMQFGLPTLDNMLGGGIPPGQT